MIAALRTESKMIVFRIMTGVGAHFVPRITEWIMSFVLLGWGMALLQEGDIFTRSPVWAVMAATMREDSWGWAAVIVSLLRVTALFINGTFKDHWFSKYSPHIRAITSAISCQFWMQVVVGIVATGYNSTGIPVYSGLAMICGVNAFRAARDAGIADRGKL
jgi:predicted signal transduction protein with EAL and GGDEF domain